MNPLIGCFWTIDALAEKYHNESVYGYVFNNPINFLDLDGNEGEEDDQDPKATWSNGYQTLEYDRFTPGVYKGYANVEGEENGPIKGGYPNGTLGPTITQEASFKQGHNFGATLRPEIDEWAVLGVDIADVIGAPYLIWKGGLKMLLAAKNYFGSSKGLITTLKSASEVYKGTTRLGHSLSKHAGRNPQIWGKLSGNPSTWHSQGMKHFDEIMNASGKLTPTTNPNGIKFLEKWLPDGRGIRLNMDRTFKGFID